MLIRLLFFSGLAFAGSPVLTYSTYLRSSFTPTAIATDPSGNIYMAGNAMVGAQTTVLVVKLNPQANQYLYAHYLSGSRTDYASGLAVDAAGNAYVTGLTSSPDFPVTGTGNLGTEPDGKFGQQSYIAKLDPTGNLVFSDLFGGSGSPGTAVAVNAAGQILVTGVNGPALPSTPGFYSASDPSNPTYLFELDPTGTKIIFSLTGIRGSAIALDPSGNIYVAGTTALLDYPTTPGAYETTFPAICSCSAFLGTICPPGAVGNTQYVSKFDPTGSHLIYSTGVGDGTNAGLAVDAAGDVFLTGYSIGGYPFTVTPPALPSSIIPFTTAAMPFLSKLDPLGRTLLFSVPVGGAGVQVDSNGAVYVRNLGLIGAHNVTSTPPALPGLPSQCVPNNSNVAIIQSSAYASQVDATSGSVLGSQFIGGSSLSTAAIALTGSNLWIAGATVRADFPFTANALTPSTLQPGTPGGAYLGAVDFSQPAPAVGAPQIGCIVDSAALAPAGLAASNQLLTILGTGLGPVTGVAASDNATFTLGGVSVNFGGVSAPILYASATQINFAVPLLDSSQTSAAMQLTVNGLPAPTRQFPLIPTNPSLFLDTAQTYQQNSPGFVALALNSDGSINSSTNPAAPASTISVFVDGVSTGSGTPHQFISNGGWTVVDSVQSGPFVVRVDLQVFPAVGTNLICAQDLCYAQFGLYDVNALPLGSDIATYPIGAAFGGMVYVGTKH